MFIHTESMIVFGLGWVVGVVFTVFALFLIGLLYRLNSLDSQHLCSDEIDFSKSTGVFNEHEKSRPRWPVQKRLGNTSLYPTQVRQRQ